MNQFDSKIYELYEINLINKRIDRKQMIFIRVIRLSTLKMTQDYNFWVISVNDKGHNIIKFIIYLSNTNKICIKYQIKFRPFCKINSLKINLKK